MPWAWLLGAVSLCMNAMLDTSRAAAAIPQLSVRYGRWRRKGTRSRGMGKFSRPDGEKCCSLACLKSKPKQTETTGWDGGSGESESTAAAAAQPACGAAIRRTGSSLFAMFRAGWVVILISATVSALMNLDFEGFVSRVLSVAIGVLCGFLPRAALHSSRWIDRFPRRFLQLLEKRACGLGRFRA